MGLEGSGGGQAGRGGPTTPLVGSGASPPGRPQLYQFAAAEYEWNPEKARESVRTVLAVILTSVLAAVALLLILFVATNLLSSQEAKNLAAEVLSPIVAVTGTVLGFYFGGRDNK